MAALNDVNHFREDLRSGGNDFAFLKIITFAGEVGNEGAGFTGNQCTGSDIPNLDAFFPVAVKAAAGCPAKIKSSRTDAAQTAGLFHHDLHGLDVSIVVIAFAEGEAGGKQGILHGIAAGDADTAGIKVSTFAFGCGKELIGHGVIDDSMEPG